MPVGRGEVGPERNDFIRYPSRSFSVINDELAKAMVRKQVGRNGWAVMFALSHRTYTDGKLGRMSAAEIVERTGLTLAQVARGMAELRNKGIIVPVVRKTAEGYRHLDRSNYGHVAQYCITKDLWTIILKQTSSTDEG